MYGPVIPPAYGGAPPVVPPSYGFTGGAVSSQYNAPGFGYAPPAASFGYGPSVPEVDTFENDPPLLEELGIDVDHIYRRIKSVVFFRNIGQELVNDLDMGGPLFIAMGLGILLMFAGKVHFGYIYGLGLLDCVGAWLLVNLMSNKQSIDLYTTMSICGYGLLPVVFLAFIGVFMNLNGSLGLALGIFTVLWCTVTASRFLECAVNMHHQRWLIAYPIAMIYICFVLITAL